ncbi:unnamed protein product [Effrenium voratum]|uniref:Palmitoyltransferase n=1 Tax=Effrenium voratum TaxID=2562239 RepID=A0AA36J623_9DINO|nr:unnamed protein product [Effrenium voratum]CAJ1400270.1 unnamed protein product [Effrenium voratum]
MEPGSLLDPEALQPRRERFGEKLKFLPIVYVVAAKLMLASIYLSQHIFKLISRQEPWDAAAQLRGWTQLSIFVPATVLLLICYVRCILVHPGEIPDDPKWEYLPRDRGVTMAPLSQEVKRTGERRHCKWCGKFKPDRCHHCRVCRTCILKMDHHCPWIYNCVGHYNYKFFILLLFYSAIDCHLILWTMMESLIRCISLPQTPFEEMFLIFFGEILAFVMAALVSVFLGMHLWLMARGLTTIEFCEKSLPKDGNRNFNSVYDLGILGNLRAVFGANVVFWFLPLGLPEGDGLTFISDETCLTKDMDGTNGIRRQILGALPPSQ